jgi:hypothetical protein
MKLKIIVLGTSLILLAFPAYTILPSLMINEANKLTGGNSRSVLTEAMLAQMGIPSIDTVIKFTKYCTIGLAVAGLGIIVFGIIAKKVPKQSAVKIATDPNQQSQEKNVDNKYIHLLQERLAKG